MKIRGGALLARTFAEKGITQVFTLSGGFCNPALEGFSDCGISVINAPHEQVAGHLADGTTRITRKPAICLVGPEGFANAIPAMMEAWGERSPVIFVTGSSTLKREGSGGFKEIDDVSIAAPLTKYSASITDGSRIPEFVDRAFKTALSGYPGPVHLSVPVDIMFSSFEEDSQKEERPLVRSPQPAPKAWPNPENLNVILEEFGKSKKPVLIGGHGVWWGKAEQKLEKAGRELQIPVYNIPYHQKLLEETSEAYMGLADIHQYPPSAKALEESDLVMMLGGRLDNQMNFGNPPLFPKTCKLICINGSPEEMEQNRSADQLLLSDPGAFLDALTDFGNSLSSQARRDWFARQQQLRREWVDSSIRDLEIQEPDEAAMHPLRLALEVQSVMNEKDWLVIDGGNTHFWSEIAVNLAGAQGKKLAGILHPGSFSMLGVGVSFGLAAKLNHPQDRVVVISGDGAFLSGGLSIEAAFQEKAPITVVIDNNGGLTTISQQQERLFRHERHVATDFRDIPFHTMFEGLGGHGELVESRDDLIPALKRAMSSGKTACINVRTRSAISPIVLATTSKRDKASIE
ncbi:MAG: thiamine pyrophosphate-binding protein [SAR324 cluster bacterium]|mgnify:FL=1|jgi:acetolactate synthase-1/2/3 large subunit|nr:thiamine pyrophosphate-binding protein [SAR324 cluster bacterium]MDP6331027.1 thiamine pyrophosphate-binding protein [SAR324 cluster bacterium]MDP7335009.1 thiamine pyrophosphate-binding protein [SAR324 cluster bacterium]MEE1577225.1 thiamine pyrophosphate-binding protein [Deltaproteobacteria bacterium]|tara:strand:- start:8093 stop:9814 length:1722 start_codon:yes stop_codon:yes gene_type:complete